MARPEELHVLKAMKDAKTGDEMRNSWHAQRPGFKDPDKPSNLDLYAARKPEMISTFAHSALTQMWIGESLFRREDTWSSSAVT